VVTEGEGMRVWPVSAMQLWDSLEQFFGLNGSEADSLDVVDAWAMLVGVVLAELRDTRVRAEQCERHERTRQSTYAIKHTRVRRTSTVCVASPSDKEQ